MWLSAALDELSARPVCGYTREAAPATEPTALAALALALHDRLALAGEAAEWLAKLQSADGSVPAAAEGELPGWTTGLAVLAWQALASGADSGQAAGSKSVARGVAWILTASGLPLGEVSADFGHDVRLVGWSYAEGTHSWIEPTAISVAALKAAGHSEHPRTREGVKLLIDRQLPEGGCNYGNTMVLGQTLRPHVQPTGLTLIALAGESDASGRVAKSRVWLTAALSPQTTPVSLAWGLMGLAAQGTPHPEAEGWLSAAGERVLARDRSPHKLALLALAAKGWPA
jgi:hypothetical protein